MHRRRSLPSAVAVLVSTVALGSTLGLSGCISSDDGPDRAAPVESPVDGVSVSLLAAGSAPTGPLVWFADDGDQTGVFTVRWGYGQKVVGGDEQGTADGEAPYSELSADLPYAAAAATDGDQLESTVTIGTPDGSNEALDEDGNADLSEDIATAEGFRMVQRYSDDGKVTSRSFAAPEEATDSARAAVENNLGQMTALPLVFPADAVGEGARWTVTGPVSDSASGVAMRQTVTYTLTSRSGSRVELDVDIERIPTVKQMAGTDLEVLDSKSTSSGSLTLDLRRPLPLSGSVKTTTEVTYGQPGSPVTVVQESRTTSTWTTGGTTGGD
ncbi:hypothetical protein [uncultured Corynebacterium sp.]|uniref:hypothetical protein n=1 Tax=uncultured Corynebacterium sp. TaxID=159447 RepID=UPI0025EA6D64|nr:hypothetical protein [uncultured Corynebacterium sp.]